MTRPSSAAYQQCTNPACRATYAVEEIRVGCKTCGSLLDISYDWSRLPVPKSLSFFEQRWATKGLHDGKLDFSGIWRFRELLPFFRTEDDIVTIGEGRTALQEADLLGKQLGMKPGKLFLQYEGLNPSGSFKDNGMTAAFTHARIVGAKKVACASTGNTSASLALFAALAEIEGIVFIGSGKISFGKLSQALDYGAKTLQIQGDFDACLRRVRQIAVGVPEIGIYLMNSVNPFRLEGQKSIMYRILEARGWEPPDWVIVPGGNLGNCSAFGKAFAELYELGLIKKIPRLAIINAAGANTLNILVNQRGLTWNNGDVDCTKIGKLYSELDAAHYKPHTVASAIEISRPVNLPKALRALEVMKGVVREVDDETILEHRAMVARWGFGCEPASAASVAGLRLLMEQQVISPSDTVVCILTGHELKDPNVTVKYHTGLDMKAVQDMAPKSEPHGKLSNRPIQVADSLEAIVMALGGSKDMLSGKSLDALAVPAGGAEY
jgi:threonine synthase